MNSLTYLEKIYEVARVLMFGALRDLVPRRYIVPEGYANPRLWAGFQCESLQRWKEQQGCSPSKSSQCEWLSHLLLADLVREQVPTFFLNGAFAEAVHQTKVKDRILTGDLHWPRKAMLFVPPVSLFDDLFSAPIPFFAVSLTKIPKLGDVVIVQIIKVESGGDGIEEIVSTAMPQFPIASDDMMVEENGVMVDPGPSGLTRDQELAKSTTHFMFKLVMAMTARPEFIPSFEPRLARPAKIKHGHEKDALWHPNIIGERYVTQRENLGGHHASPRIHCRCGHFRNQAHGPQRSLRKVIWLEPCWVGGDVAP